MSHLHVPDGVLPPLLWIPGAVLALVAVALSARVSGDSRGLGLRGALGALMLAVMAIPIPLFALEYCLTLAGPIGVLVGGLAGVQIAFAVTVVLAFLGQGGFSVVGLNVLVLSAGMAVARPAYRALVRRASPAVAMAGATAAAQFVSGGLWFGLLALALRLDPHFAFDDHGHGHGRTALFSTLALGL